MVAKKQSTNKPAQTKGKVKVGKLQLTKETVKNLSDSQQKQIKGGFLRTKPCTYLESGCSAT